MTGWTSASAAGGRAPRRLRCRTVATSVHRQMNYVRDLPPIAVEERLGSSDHEPVATASEMLLAAMGSCAGARIHANAGAANIRVCGLEPEVEANNTVSTLWEPLGIKPHSAGFETISVTVHMDADASPDALRALIAHALLWSPVVNTIHDPVHLAIQLGRTSALASTGTISKDPNDA